LLSIGFAVADPVDKTCPSHSELQGISMQSYGCCRPVAVVAVLCCLGCGGSDRSKAKRPKVVPADGVITYQGKPLDGATIVLSPTGDGKTGASAMSDVEGKFQLSAFPPDMGAVPGEYKVGVSKQSVVVMPEPPPGMHAEDMPRPPKPKALIPDKFANPEKSGLKTTVPEAGSTELKIELN
jgi:hypothetical protein